MFSLAKKCFILLLEEINECLVLLNNTYSLFLYLHIWNDEVLNFKTSFRMYSLSQAFSGGHILEQLFCVPQTHIPFIFASIGSRLKGGNLAEKAELKQALLSFNFTFKAVLICSYALGLLSVWKLCFVKSK